MAIGRKASHADQLVFRDLISLCINIRTRPTSISIPGGCGFLGKLMKPEQGKGRFPEVQPSIDIF